jgi:hypothetical protein
VTTEIQGISILRRMPAGENPVTPNRESVGVIIEMEGSDRGATDGRQPDDAQAVVAPTKVFGPRLRSRVEQGARLSGFGVYRMCPIAFVVIAEGTNVRPLKLTPIDPRLCVP